MRIIEVQNYNNKWPLIFKQEQKKLAAFLPVKKSLIHHIGSTAVPGLSAKPIIDILIEVENINCLDAFDQKFQSIGYETKGEFGISGRRHYQKGGENRSHHIHAFESKSAAVVRHIAFREYLKAHPQIAKEYGVLKLSLALTFKNSIDLYAKGKCEFVSKHEKLALTWWACVSN